MAACRRREDYTVGWICALPVEMAAAISMLDEIHPDLPARRGDYNTYVLGCIQWHNVVIACLPSGIYGTTSAATVAAAMRLSYPLLQVGLMVGIGGGVPNPQSDIRLGDVVVSRPTRNSGGVIQYDHGKTVSTGQFEHTGTLNKPPYAALTAMSRLQAQHQLRESDIPNLLAEAAKKHKGSMIQFEYPGEDQDRLFDSAYDHPVSEDTCDHCDTRRFIVRKRRTTTTPHIHYGLIASGNQVMKHGVTRDRLSRQYGFLCFEMEAAGLVDHFPCAVIRGICDYADSHKTKQWQGYAALTASAYTKELLSVMAPMDIPMTGLCLYRKTLRAQPKSSSWAIFRPHGLKGAEDVILRNLSQYDHEKVHRRLSHKRVEGTTQWFIEHPDFQDWLNGRSPSLWCTGKIGSGKTLIATSAVDVVKCHSAARSIPTVFFYCETDTPCPIQGTSILTSFINQLYPFLTKKVANHVVGEVLRSMTTFFGPDRIEPDFEDLEEILIMLNCLIPETVFIIDGFESLAEDDVKKLLKLFRSLFSSGPSVRILVSSREHLPGGYDIGKEILGVRQISTSSNVTHDIEIYINESFRERALYKKLTDNAELLEDVKKKLLSGASEMFLWVYLQIEVLWDTCVTDAEIRLALNNLPKDLEETYHRCLERIHSGDSRTVKILKWVSFASRPLHVEELREAVAFGLEDEKWDSERIPMRNFVVGCCANLIVEDPVDGMVRFAHPSVARYLQKNSNRLATWPESLQNGQLECGELCVSYLSFADFCLQIERRYKAPRAPRIPDPMSLGLAAMKSSTLESFFHRS
ncbi:purine and uridine phosphorylase [Aspergillus egyptiacus]|nr:purine and uridine phosphorylase [Aspergillus egyptiacus]